MTEQATDAAKSASRAGAFVLPLHGVTIFVSAALLFAVQPMFAKMVLPRLGGSPAVWSVAMVFFQAALLAGYAYAHALTRWSPPRAAVAIHLVVLVAAMIFLPLKIASGWAEPPEAGAAFWLVGLFTVSIGAPFFALSANGPLLQAWFARSRHKDAGDPYFLYAASNIGSFMALIGYPILAEPFFTLGQQTWAWTLGYGLLAALVLACGAAMLTVGGAGGREISVTTLRDFAPNGRDFVGWMLLAAAPSGLLVAVTAHVSTDVAAAPFLWVVPLALYLATFAIVFQGRPLFSHRSMLFAQLFAATALVAAMAFERIDQILITLAVHFGAFFIFAMVCHGELAMRRPSAAHLTVFYLALSLGGVIGGVFAGLVAPYAFSWVAEYPILIVCALLGRAGLWLPVASAARRMVFAGAALGLALLVPGALGYLPGEIGAWLLIGIMLALVAAACAFRRETLAIAGAVALVFAAVRLYPTDGAVRYSVRSFFGVHKIAETKEGRFRVLSHGTTTHGAQRLRDEAGKPLAGRPQPLTYYYAGAPMPRAIEAARGDQLRALRVAVVGLGAGSLACHARAGDDWTFFEIDPEVIRIARDPKLFSFLAECLPNAPIVLGDARLTLAKQPDARFDVIVVDAFSSDAIPVHLITKEAMAVYLAKLAPGGYVVLHISNIHMSLTQVVVGIASAHGLVTFTSDEVDDDNDDEYKFESEVAVVARQHGDLRRLPKSAFSLEAPEPGQHVWTDDYSNILGAIIRSLRE